MKGFDLAQMLKAQRKFAKQRDWDQFHTPKNLAIGLSIEASELLEVFQWKTDQEVQELLETAVSRAHFEQEIADVLFYLIRLADVTGTNLQQAFWRKMKLNAKKYPVRLARGNAKKWNQLRTRPASGKKQRSS